MKNMDDIDKIEDYEMELKKKYDEFVVPDYMFDTTKIFERARQLKIQQYRRRRTMRIASIVTVLIISAVVISTFVVNNKEETNNNIMSNENDIKYEQAKISGNIKVSENIINYEKDICNNVCSVKINEILEYKIIDGIPFTRVKAQVLDNYYNYIEGEIEMIVPGGIFTVKEIKENIDTIRNEEIMKYEDDEIVSAECYRDIYSPIATKEKIYLTTLNNENGIFSVCSGKMYGFKEYDPETNTIKDMGGNSVPVEIDKYIENL